MSLGSVARGGDYLETLRALRDYLADALDQTESDRDRASLALRLADVLAQINALEGGTADDDARPDDDLGALVAFPGR